MSVADELPRRKYGWDELCAIDHGIETSLQQSDHVGAGIALHADRLLIDAAELPLGNIAVIAAQLLLRPQLNTVIRELAFAPLAVLARTIFPAADGALWAAPDILAHAAIDLVLRLVALGHRVLIFCCCARIAPSFAPVVPEPTGLPERQADRGQRTPRKHAEKSLVLRDARFLGAKVDQVKPDAYSTS